MESFWRSLAIWLGKQWKVVATGVFVITLVLALFGASNINFATGQDSYLNPSSQIAIDNVEFQDEFGGETVILLFTANEPDVDVTDLFVGDNLETLRNLDEDLNLVGNISSIITPLTSLTWSDDLVKGAGRNALIAASTRDEAGADARSADISIGLARLGEIPSEEQEIGNPAWNELLVYGNDGFTVGDDGVVPPPDDERAIRLSLASTYPNPQTAVGGIVLGGNLSLEDQSAATEEVLAVLEGIEFDGFELTVTGSPVYLKEINDYLRGGMLTLGLAAIAVMAIILGFLFKVRWRLLPLLAVVFGILWTFSIMGLIGIDLSLVTISGLPILIGVGIDFAIQIHNRVEEEVTLDHDQHPIGETLANLAPPLIAATLAGVAAFLALRLSLVPMIRDFGILLAVGIAVLVVVGIVIPSASLGIREYVDPSTERGVSAVERIVVKLGSLPVKAGLVLVLLSIGLFVGGIAAETRTRIESDPIKWIDQGSQVVA
ncbi:MAG: MMPL family transporter, partial [Acidimicrobiia bacterium]